MNCDKCGISFSGLEALRGEGVSVYQVRVGYVDGEEFYPTEDVGYYCDGCLAEGV